MYNLLRHIIRKNINRINRKRLINCEFSIISSNCVGGVICHELGQKFRSPTVNLYMDAPDYIKFLKNLEFYLNDANMIEINEGRKFPVGLLYDIKIYFVHYPSFNDAMNKWKERKSRINRDNLFVIMVQKDNCSMEQIKEFDKLQYRHKVIFTTKQIKDIKSSYYIPGSEIDDEEVMDLCLYKHKLGGKRWIDEFDYVKFLNSAK